jgi:hypothetical protein
MPFHNHEMNCSCSVNVVIFIDTTKHGNPLSKAIPDQKVFWMNYLQSAITERPKGFVKGCQKTQISQGVGKWPKSDTHEMNPISRSC